MKGRQECTAFDDSLLELLNIPDLTHPPKLLDPPAQIDILQYAGIAPLANLSSDFNPDILHFNMTAPTTILEPIRDILTGQVTGYKDSPIASVSTDDSAINRPITSMDDYHLGAVTGVAFTPGGFAPAPSFSPDDVIPFIQSLETGTNLLSTPGSTESTSGDVPQSAKGPGSVSDEFSEIFPTIGQVDESPAPRPKAQQLSDINRVYAIEDKWDISCFDKEIPNPALTFPFKLDPFQIRSIHRLELGQTVFVSAPTSAGKTVIAQYAIALCRAHKMKTLYTSPIKALSNQKFRDLSHQFGDVGILTGDVSINRDASCLIMTTEILRSMLYHGADLLRDVECVIFDECHFIANDERGVVWEEAIILLPYHINMVFLSATVPNAMEIADWIGRTKQRVVYVQNHYLRPVPLEHCLYTGDGNFYVVSRPGCGLNYEGLLAASESLIGEPGVIDYSDFYWQSFIKGAVSHGLSPILVFCFSQRLCEQLAETVKSIPLLDSSEKRHVRGFCRKALQRLSKEDRELPQIQTIFELLEHGIGIHHGGVLPILKEIIEILLTDGFVKVLFCTSTFAMGINVPARACAFVSLEKSNGKKLLPLTPTEYVQMSGRAGRRGLDTVGTSIIICHGEIPEDRYLSTLFNGRVEALESQFYLKFNMILNLLRVKDIGMTDLLRHSLSANLIQSMMPQLNKELKEVKKELKELPKIECVLQDIEDISNFTYSLLEAQDTASWLEKQLDIHSFLRQLLPGRVIFVTDSSLHIPEFLVVTQAEIIENVIEGRGINANGKEALFEGRDIAAFFQKPSKNSLIALRPTPENVSNFLKTFETKDQENQILPWTKVFATSDFEFTEASLELAKLVDEMRKSPCWKCALLKNHLETAKQRQYLLEREEECDKKMRDESLSFKPLLDRHIAFLKANGYITEDSVLMLKGRVCMEINSCDEILGTELLFSNIFRNLTPEEIASVCAGLVSEGVNGRNDDEGTLIPANLPNVYEEIEATASDLFEKMNQAGIGLSDDWIEKNVNFVLGEAVFEWAEGRSFTNIMSITGVPEGNVVRVINRVNELLKDFATASKVMGTVSLAEKFEVAAEKIKRDIIFASSLYID